jgi:hypothetical protein
MPAENVCVAGTGSASQPSFGLRPQADQRDEKPATNGLTDLAPSAVMRVAFASDRLHSPLPCDDRDQSAVYSVLQ